MLRPKEMKKTRLTKENLGLLFLLVLVVGGLVLSVMGVIALSTDRPFKSTARAPTPQAPPALAQAGPGFRTISTGTTGEGDVQIELTPRSVQNGQLRVAIAANTHSVELAQYDLAAVVTLESDGKSFSPATAPTFSGHHNAGDLVFDVGKGVSAFTIRIRGIPQVGERVYSWP